MSIFSRFFTEEAPQQADIAPAQEVLAYASLPYHHTLMEYFQTEADKPIQITSDTAMIAAIARANAFKEVRGKILQDIRRAEALVIGAKESR